MQRSAVPGSLALPREDPKILFERRDQVPIGS